MCEEVCEDVLLLFTPARREQVLAVLGPSGAGKTTLLSMLTLERRGGVGVGDIARVGRGRGCSEVARNLL